MKRTLLVGFCVFVISVGPYAGCRWYKLSHYGEWYSTVLVGDDLAVVLGKMGSPDVVQRRPDWLWCTSPKCVKDFMYGRSMPPEWWVIGFDIQGRVIEKEYLVSP